MAGQCGAQMSYKIGRVVKRSYEQILNKFVTINVLNEGKPKRAHE